MIESSDMNLPVGAIVIHRGVKMRHVGGGRFVPADDLLAAPQEEPLVKRFDAGGPLLPLAGGSC